MGFQQFVSERDTCDFCTIGLMEQAMLEEPHWF